MVLRHSANATLKMRIFHGKSGIEVINSQRFYRESDSGENLVKGKENCMIELSG